jgi:hypothetical protein
MKKIMILVVMIQAFHFGKSQDASNYTMFPAGGATIFTGGKVQISFQYIGTNGLLAKGTSDASMGRWTIDGKFQGQQDPAEGSLKVLDGLKATTVEYTAPDKIPPVNPVAIAVSFHPSADSKSLVTLVCNVTVVSGYKVTAEMELTGPDGIHIVLSGECITKLKPLADGTNMLEPVDGKSDMNITVKTFSMAKGFALVGPWQYSIPIFISIGKINGNSPSPAKLVLQRFGPDQTETYSADGHSVQEHMIHPLFFNAFIKDEMQTQRSNIADGEDQQAWAERMQAHRGDPAYFKTAQGQADVQRMQKLQQELGGNISNPDLPAQQLAQQMAQKAKQDPNYIGSAQYQQDLGKQQMLSQANKDMGGKTPMAKTPLSGVLNVEGSFNAGGTTPLEMTKESTTGGALHGEIKIQVVKG